MKADEAHQIAEQAKEHLLSQVEAYAFNVVLHIKASIKDCAQRGSFRDHFKHCPNDGVPFNVLKETMPLIFKQLTDEGYTVVFDHKDGGRQPDDFTGGFTISW